MTDCDISLLMRLSLININISIVLLKFYDAEIYRSAYLRRMHVFPILEFVFPAMTVFGVTLHSSGSLLVSR